MLIEGFLFGLGLIAAIYFVRYLPGILLLGGIGAIIVSILVGAYLAITIYGYQLINTAIVLLVMVGIGILFGKIGDYLKALPSLNKKIHISLRVFFWGLVIIYSVALITVLIAKAFGKI